MAFSRSPVLPVLLLGLAPLASAAAKPQAPAAPAPAAPAVSVEPRVEARVNAYWKVRSTLNLAACLPFYESSFRKQHTPESFARDFRRLNRFAPEFQGVEKVTLDASGTKATVKTRLKTKVESIGGQDLEAVVEEVWVLEDGEWWKQGEAVLPQI